MTIIVPDNFKKSVTVTRPGVSNYVQGRHVDGISSTFTIEASVQPASSTDMQTLTEGQRSKGAIRLYSNDELKIGSESGVTKGDVVNVLNKNWEVQSIMYWNTPWFYWKAIATEVDGQ